MNKVENTINDLIHAGFIPDTGEVIITEELLSRYIHKYGNGTKLRKSQRSLSRKIAGINLMKLNFKRGVRNINAGIVYVVSNPAWPSMLKIGMTIDLNTRLSQYQTYDPFRAFKVENYDFVLNRRLVERMVIEEFKIDLDKGEWISKATTEEVRKFLVHHNSIL
jgi:hypothetical protein